MDNLTYRKATKDDVEKIVELLLEDELGQTRENKADMQRYIKAFEQINIDLRQFLMLVIMSDEIVGTCHLTLLPSMTFKGQTRMQIEAVRVAEKYRGHKIGEWMINEAIHYGKSNGATMIQLMTNKTRVQAKKFYEKLGFEATHEGMKLLF